MANRLRSPALSLSGVPHPVYHSAGRIPPTPLPDLQTLSRQLQDRNLDPRFQVEPLDDYGAVALSSQATEFATDPNGLIYQSIGGAPFRALGRFTLAFPESAMYYAEALAELGNMVLESSPPPREDSVREEPAIVTSSILQAKPDEYLSSYADRPWVPVYNSNFDVGVKELYVSYPHFPWSY